MWERFPGAFSLHLRGHIFYPVGIQMVDVQTKFFFTVIKLDLLKVSAILYFC